MKTNRNLPPTHIFRFSLPLQFRASRVLARGIAYVSVCVRVFESECFEYKKSDKERAAKERKRHTIERERKETANQLLSPLAE